MVTLTTAFGAWQPVQELLAGGRRWGAGSRGRTFVNGCHTLVDLVHQAACQVLNVCTPLLTLLPGQPQEAQQPATRMSAHTSCSLIGIPLTPAVLGRRSVERAALAILASRKSK
jgi:hypothetical protein